MLKREGSPLLHAFLLQTLKPLFCAFTHFVDKQEYFVNKSKQS